MTYQLIYSSRATLPMQADDLEALLARARTKNDLQGISGALIYTDGTFLQILEGERAAVEALMADIRKDRRHDSVTVLREGGIPQARFSSWKMAYVSATPEQAAQWSDIRSGTEKHESAEAIAENLRRTAQFVRDIQALLSPQEPRAPETAPS